MDQLSVWKMECKVERGLDETILLYEQKEINLSVDHYNTEEAVDDLVRFMAV